MMLEALDTSRPAAAVPWYLSTGFLGGLGLALSSLVTLIVYAAQVGSGAAALDPQQLVTLVMGVVQAVASIGLIVWRAKKGSDPSRPEPRLSLGRPGGGGTAPPLVALAVAGAALLMAGCGPIAMAPQTPAVAGAMCDSAVAMTSSACDLAAGEVEDEGDAERLRQAAAALRTVGPMACDALEGYLQAAAQKAAAESADGAPDVIRDER